MHGGLECPVVQDAQRAEVWAVRRFGMLHGSGCAAVQDFMMFWMLSSLCFGICGSLRFSMEM